MSICVINEQQWYTRSLNVLFLIMISFENGRPISFAYDFSFFVSLITWVFLFRWAMKFYSISIMAAVDHLQITIVSHLKTYTFYTRMSSVSARQNTKQYQEISLNVRYFCCCFLSHQKMVINLYVFSIGFIVRFLCSLGRDLIFFILFLSL